MSVVVTSGTLEFEEFAIGGEAVKIFLRADEAY